MDKTEKAPLTMLVSEFEAIILKGFIVLYEFHSSHISHRVTSSDCFEKALLDKIVIGLFCRFLIHDLLFRLPGSAQHPQCCKRGKLK